MNVNATPTMQNNLIKKQIPVDLLNGGRRGRMTINQKQR